MSCLANGGGVWLTLAFAQPDAFDDSWQHRRSPRSGEHGLPGRGCEHLASYGGRSPRLLFEPRRSDRCRGPLDGSQDAHRYDLEGRAPQDIATTESGNHFACAGQRLAGCRKTAVAADSERDIMSGEADGAAAIPDITANQPTKQIVPPRPKMRYMRFSAAG